MSVKQKKKDILRDRADAHRTLILLIRYSLIFNVICKYLSNTDKSKILPFLESKIRHLKKTLIRGTKHNLYVFFIVIFQIFKKLHQHKSQTIKF